MCDREADWVAGFPASIVVTDASGMVISMNRKALETFQAEGGAELLGTDVRQCHPPGAREKVERLLETHGLNAYTIEKNGVRKLIYQSPWFEAGEFAGYVELSLPIPPDMPHFDRGGRKARGEQPSD